MQIGGVKGLPQDFVREAQLTASSTTDAARSLELTRSQNLCFQQTPATRTPSGTSATGAQVAEEDVGASEGMAADVTHSSHVVEVDTEAVVQSSVSQPATKSKETTPKPTEKEAETAGNNVVTPTCCHLTAKMHMSGSRRALG